MIRRWWDEDRGDDPRADCRLPTADLPRKARATRAQLIEYRAALRVKLMLMRPRSANRRDLEKSLVRATAALLRREMEEA